MIRLPVFTSLGLLQIGTVTATPGVTPPDETIDGFPEFDVELERNAEVKERLRKIAKKIVASHSNSPRRIIGFEVHGHADRTMRLTGAERETTEFEVSRDRAENAMKLLLQMIEEEGGTPIIAGIKANSKATGFGSKHRLFDPATTEAQMRKNRRVEIFLKEFESPPSPPSPPDPPPTPEVRTKFRVQIKKGTIVIVGTPTIVSLATGFTAITKLDLVIFDDTLNQSAKFKASCIGKTPPPIGLIGPEVFATIILREGPPREFTALPGTRLSNFEGDLLIGRNAGIDGFGLGGTFEVFFEALRGPTRPKPVDVKAGNIPGIPKTVIAIIPISGSLKMVGLPTKSLLLPRLLPTR
jgi:hypothetical protein